MIFPPNGAPAAQPRPSSAACSVAYAGLQLLAGTVNMESSIFLHSCSLVGTDESVAFRSVALGCSRPYTHRTLWRNSSHLTNTNSISMKSGMTTLRNDRYEQVQIKVFHSAPVLSSRSWATTSNMYGRQIRYSTQGAGIHAVFIFTNVVEMMHHIIHTLTTWTTLYISNENALSMLLA